MPRYDVITYNLNLTRGHNFTIPGEFLEAVNASLAKGATLVGGVSTSAGGWNSDSGYFSFSQAVLYP